MSSPTAVTSRKPFDHNQPSVSGTTADAEPSSPVKVLEFVKVVAPLRGPISVRVNKGSIVNQGDLLAVQVSTKVSLFGSNHFLVDIRTGLGYRY